MIPHGLWLVFHSYLVEEIQTENDEFREEIADFLSKFCLVPSTAEIDDLFATGFVVGKLTFVI